MNNIAKRIRRVPNAHCHVGIRDQFLPYLCSRDKEIIKDASAEWFDCREFFHNDFDDDLKKERGYFYGALDAEVKSIAQMFEFVEAILNLKQCYRSTIYNCEGVAKTNSVYNRDVDTAALIDLSPFWLSSRTRCQFSTIITRAAARRMIVKKIGAHDVKPTPDELSNPVKKATLTYRTPLQAIMAIDYCQETARATAMFLDGYTLFRPATKVKHCESDYDGTFDASGTIRSFNESHWVSKFSFDITAKCANRLVRPGKKRDLKWFRRSDPRSLLTTNQRRQLIEWINNQEADYFPHERHILSRSDLSFVYDPKAANRADANES